MKPFDDHKKENASDSPYAQTNKTIMYNPLRAMYDTA